MHICFLALDYPSPQGGAGVGRQVQLLGRELVRRGHRVSVVALAERGQPEVEEDDGVRVYRMQRGALHWYLSKTPVIGPMMDLTVRELEDSWGACRLVQRIDRSSPIDVIEGTETGTLATALLVRRIPLVVRLHGEVYTFRKNTPGFEPSTGVKWQRALQRLALRRARALVAPSSGHGKEILEELGLASDNVVRVIPNAVGPELIDAGDPGAQPSGRNHRILYAGRLDRSKGVLVLLAAMRRVVDAVPDAQLVLLGSPHPSLPMHEIRNRISDLGLAEHVVLRGHVAGGELLDEYRRACVSVLPSYYEAFGLSALESMAAGVAPVVTDVGGLPELVEDGISGLVVPSGNEIRLADALIRLLEDDSLRLRLATSARTRAKERYGLDGHVTASLHQYECATEAEWLLDGVDAHTFFSPHFDDAVFSAGGVIARLSCSPQPVGAITVFGGEADGHKPSAFERHLDAKWKRSAGEYDRSGEDREALKMLRVEEIAHWTWPEGPKRRSAGRALYATYDDLSGELRPEDLSLIHEIATAARGWTANRDGTTRLWFPLGLGRHVDHQILAGVGLRLRAEGFDVLFYEDFPYAEAYRVERQAGPWQSQILPADLESKLGAVLRYKSQLPGLGTSIPEVMRRFSNHAREVGGQQGPAERFWRLSKADARSMVESGHLTWPYRLRRRSPADAARSLLSSRRVPAIEDLLSPGRGLCLLVGCKLSARIGPLAGYQTLEIGVENLGAAQLDEPAAAIVVCHNRLGARDVERLITGAARLLEQGGVLCGHLPRGKAARAMQAEEVTAGKVRQLLDDNRFRDVVVRPAGVGLPSPSAIAFSARYAGD